MATRIDEQEALRRLHEAAQKGSVASLLDLLHDHPLILDRVIVDCISETPLHIAVMLGHIDFTKEILSRKTELTRELDSKGSSPLHLASAKGYVDIVKELLKIDPDICLVRDELGRTPLHLAAIKGRVEVLNELVHAKPEATWMTVDRGEMILHLTVKHNRLEALKMLVKAINDDEFVKSTDDDGNTILHLAIAKKQIETVKFVLTSTGVDVNTLNRNGFTALDVLAQSSRDLRDMDIGDYLRDAGARRGRGMSSATDGHDEVQVLVPHKATAATQPPPTQSSNNQEPDGNRDHWLVHTRSGLMVVASLIATVAFQAGLSPPGGVWQDNPDSSDNKLDTGSRLSDTNDYNDDYDTNSSNDHTAGVSIMSDTGPDSYPWFLICNTIAFTAALSINLLLVSGFPLDRKTLMGLLMMIMWIAITSMAITFTSSVEFETGYNTPDYILNIPILSLFAMFGLSGIIFLVNFLRLVLWSLWKLKILKKRVGLEDTLLWLPRKLKIMVKEGTRLVKEAAILLRGKLKKLVEAARMVKEAARGRATERIC